MPGRVSVDEAVKAIRSGLAKGKMHIVFPTRFGFIFAAALQATRVFAAHTAAQDGTFMKIAIISGGIAGLTCAAAGRSPSGDPV